MNTIFLLQNYNTRVVVLSSVLLGITCGVLGVFLLLRKRALVSDALSHAGLPGIAIAYLTLSFMGMDGKNIVGLLMGAVVTSSAAMGLLLLLRRRSLVKEDALIALLLSSFFGLGIALLGIIQKIPRGHAAGLQHFIYGDTASMLRSDLLIMIVMFLLILMLTVLFFKEITAVTFDQEYARGLGYKPVYIDMLVIAMTIITTVAGMQAVGIILIIALLIIPAVSAHCWSNNLKKISGISAIFGAISCYSGTLLSAYIARLPAGSSIVLVAGLFLIISVTLGKNKGILYSRIRSARRRRKMELHQLLLALRLHYNLEQLSTTRNIENYLQDQPHIIHHWLMDQMRITDIRLQRIINRAYRGNLLKRMDRKSYRLTPHGAYAMLAVTREHEIYHTFIHLYPQRISDLNHNQESSIEGILSAPELREVYRYMHAKYSYLLLGKEYAQSG